MKQIIINLLIALAVVDAIGFQLILEKRAMRCFADNYSQGLLVFASVTSKSSEYSFKIIDPKKSKTLTFYNEKGTLEHSVQFYSNGSHQDKQTLHFCFYNLATQPIILQYEYMTGSNANDFNALANHGDLNQVQYQIQQLKNITIEINNDMKSLTEISFIRYSQVQSVSVKIILLSIMTLGLMTITTFIQVIKIKRFFIDKKLI